MDIKDFEGKGPRLRLEEFFAGKLKGWGFTVSRFGNFQNSFRIDAQAHWDVAANTLKMTEFYKFDDGHNDPLDWSRCPTRNTKASRSRSREAPPENSGATPSIGGNRAMFRIRTEAPPLWDLTTGSGSSNRTSCVRRRPLSNLESRWLGCPAFARSCPEFSA